MLSDIDSGMPEYLLIISLSPMKDAPDPLTVVNQLSGPGSGGAGICTRMAQK